VNASFPYFLIMKKIFLLLYIPSCLWCQNTFNFQSNFAYPFIKFTNVLPTDSCYFVTAVIRDSTNQQNLLGSLFLKFNLEGDTIFSKKLIVPSKNYLTWDSGLLSAPDGNLLCAGESSDSIQKVFIMKYSPTGDTQFVREFINPTYPMETFVTAENVNQHGNKIYLLGGYNPSSGFVEGNIYVNKIDKNGNLLLQKTYGSSATELVKSSIVEEDGGLIIGACKTNSNQVLEGFNRRTYIFKTDSLGNVVWEYLSPSGQLRDRAYSMVKTPDGGLVVGSGKGIEYEVNASVGQLRWHAYIFKLNANHQQIWGRELRGTRQTGTSGFKKVVTATDGGGFVACGKILESKSDAPNEVFGSWIAKVSNQGDSLWARYYSIFDDHIRSPDPIDFKATPDGGYIVVGQTDEG
jgi:hypothetical protein